ncbi:MAG: hypothetical protein U1E91_05640 [Moraxella sp.]
MNHENSGTTQANNKGTHPAATPLLKNLYRQVSANSQGSPSKSKLIGDIPNISEAITHGGDNKLPPASDNLASVNTTMDIDSDTSSQRSPFMCSKSILATVF